MILEFSGGDDLFFAESSEESDPNRLNFSRLAALGAQNDLRFTPAAAGEEIFECLEFLNLESSGHLILAQKLGSTFAVESTDRE